MIGVSYFIAVAFGVITLYFYAVQRFEDPSGTIPLGYNRLALTPQLMTRQDKHQNGQSLYIGIIIVFYLVVTVWPAALASIVDVFAANEGAGGGQISASIAKLLDTDNPTFPMAIALLITSNSFLKAFAQPELFIRRFCHRISGIPTDLAFLTQVVLSASSVPARDAAVIQAINPHIEKNLNVNIAAISELKTNTPRLYQATLNTVLLAATLERIYQVVRGIASVQDDYRRYVDYQVFLNIWPKAADRIRELSLLLQQEQKLNESLKKSAENTQSGTIEALESEGLEQRLLILHEDLATLVAAALATGGTRDIWTALKKIKLADAEAKEPQMLRYMQRTETDISAFAKPVSIASIIIVTFTWFLYFPADAEIRNLTSNIPLIQSKMLETKPPKKEAENKLEEDLNDIKEAIAKRPFPTNWHAALGSLTATSAVSVAFFASWRRRLQMKTINSYHLPEDGAGNKKTPGSKSPAFGAYIDIFATGYKSAFFIIACAVTFSYLGILNSVGDVISQGVDFQNTCADLLTDLKLSGISASVTIVFFTLLVVVVLFSLLPALTSLCCIILADHITKPKEQTKDSNSQNKAADSKIKSFFSKYRALFVKTLFSAVICMVCAIIINISVDRLLAFSIPQALQKPEILYSRTTNALEDVLRKTSQDAPTPDEVQKISYCAAVARDSLGTEIASTNRGAKSQSSFGYALRDKNYAIHIQEAGPIASIVNTDLEAYIKKWRKENSSPLDIHTNIKAALEKAKNQQSNSPPNNKITAAYESAMHDRSGILALLYVTMYFLLATLIILRLRSGTTSPSTDDLDQNPKAQPAE
ncbi:hypothetical protein [Ferrovibrio terrae]|uniref:hypothetical protein n=1 Tax=Ferrovibrio terrae TaxID=2594003 RepID=UPI0031380FAE